MIDKGEIKNEKEKRCNPCGCTHTHTLVVLKKIRKFRYIAKLNLVDN